MSTVVLTQPLPRVAALAQELQAAGHLPIVCPFTELAPDPGELRRLAQLGATDYERVLLVSPSAAQFFVAGVGGRLPAGIRLGVVGPGSAHALRAAAGTSALDIVHPRQPPYDADALLAEPALREIAGRRLLVLRGERGRADWTAVLAARGAQVDERVLYRSRPVAPEAGARAALGELARRAGAATFVVTTSSAGQRLARWVDACGFGAWARAQRALTVHPRIKATLAQCGWARVECMEPGERSLLVALES